MTDESPEYTEGGSRVYRHKAVDGPGEIPSQDLEAVGKLESHIKQHIPGEGTVFHEIVSDKVHLDVHIRNPTSQRNYYTLVTIGMSDRPMKAPPGAEDHRYAELVLCLPATWPINQKAFADEANYWPIRWLKKLARLPHDYTTWLWVAHTVPNGDPARPFARNTKMCGVILASPVQFGSSFLRVEVNDQKTVYFNSVIPLYQDEMDFKLKSGADALFELLGQNRVSELLDLNRKSVVKRKGLFGKFG